MNQRETALRWARSLVESLDWPRMVFWRGRIFGYTGSHYECISDTDLCVIVLRRLQALAPETCCRKSFVGDVVANIKGLVLAPASLVPGQWLDLRSSGNFVCLQNGLLDLEAFLRGESEVIRPHDSGFFSLCSVGSCFDLSAVSPLWDSVLREILPGADERMLLAEWFGYCLAADTSFQKFLVMYGPGGNGKSVICAALQGLLGDRNVVSLGLEAFDPRRTFGLAATEGKLANITNELNESSKAGEGLLKQFVSGDDILCERKHEAPFQLRPTARLTFATNVLPGFTDRSDGLWRRIMIIPLKQRFLDPAKQDRRLVEPAFWAQTETSGILNWALGGLSRLHRNKRFSVPQSCADLLNEFRSDANPTQAFLESEFESEPHARLSSTDLYRSYADALRETGAEPLGHRKLSEEIRRVFPGVRLEKNATRNVSGRVRHWLGLRRRSGTTDTQFPDFERNQ